MFLLVLVLSCSKDEIEVGEPCIEGTEEVWIMVESMPMFPGCDQPYYDYECHEQKISQFINFNLHYPREARSKKIEGDVVVSMIIEKEGCITTIEIMKSLGYGCDEEAMRIVKMMPPWKPGRVRGEAERVRYPIRVSFKLLTDG